MARTVFDEKFADLVNAGFPYIYIPSYEEDRVTEAVRETIENSGLVRTKRALYIWTQTEGLISDDRGLIMDDLRKAIRETVPLSIRQKEQIRKLKEWAGSRAVLATAKEDRETSDSGTYGSGQGGRIVDFD